MQNQKAEHYFYPTDDHNGSVDLQGLEDLFQWASEMVADGLDGRSRRERDQKVKKQVLKIIHRSADMQAKAKHADELAYLQRRVISLQGVLAEKMDELGNLKQIVLAQYFGLQRIPELEEKLVQLEAQSLDRQEVEAERRELMTALSKLKKDRDYLDELLSVSENENSRLASLLNDAKAENTALKNRRWWHLFFPPTTK